MTRPRLTLRRIGFIAAILLSFVTVPALAALQVAIRDADGVIVNYGTSATGGTGLTVCSPDLATVHALATAQAGPNGGVSLTGYTGPDSNGNCAGGSVGVLPTPTPMPTTVTLAVGAGLGVSPPTPTFVPGAGSTIYRGQIRFGTGTSTAVGVILTATFPTAFVSPPAIWVQPMTLATVNCRPFVSAVTTTTATFNCGTAPTASQIVTTFQFMYGVTP